MKIQLDTTKKTIKVEESVSLNEFFTKLKQILPQNEWKNFTLESTAEIYWSNPIVIKEYPPRDPYPYVFPWYGVTTSTTTAQYKAGKVETAYQLQSGTYNVEI